MVARGEEARPRGRVALRSRQVPLVDNLEVKQCVLAGSSRIAIVAAQVGLVENHIPFLPISRRMIEVVVVDL